MGSGRAARQSGVIPYRIRRGALEVLLVTNVGRSHWIVPKGNIESHLTPAESAAKEAYEEAGIIGVVETRSIGSFEYVKRAVARIVCLFPMAVADVLDEWPEMAHRSRTWTSVEMAAVLVRYPQLDRCILDLRGWLGDELHAEGPPDRRRGRQAA